MLIFRHVRTKNMSASKMELHAIAHNFYQKCTFLFVFTHRHQEGVLVVHNRCKHSLVLQGRLCCTLSKPLIAVTGLTMSYRNTLGFCLLQKQDSVRMQNEFGWPNYVLKSQRAATVRSLRDYDSLTSCRGHDCSLSK